MDRVAFNIRHSSNGKWTDETSKVGYYGNVVLTARFKVTCDANYYGSDCFTYCVATDNSRGHYTCDANGGKKCKAGYQNPSTNCITREKPNYSHTIHTNYNFLSILLKGYPVIPRIPYSGNYFNTGMYLFIDWLCTMLLLITGLFIYTAICTSGCHPDGGHCNKPNECL